MVKLILLRHGQSTANAKNEYTGWSDVDLTSQGMMQARWAGKMLRQHHLTFERVHTSVLKRAIVTAYLVQEQCLALAVPIQKTWRLNERHYGALRGLNKETTRQQYGSQQVALWRRSFDSVPPKLAQKDVSQRIYQSYSSDILPRAESLKMALQRTIPYFQDQIGPRLYRGHNQLIVAHGSTLRAMIKYLEHISDDRIDGVEVGNCEPIIYQLDDQLRIQDKQILSISKMDIKKEQL
ncbi:2,3-diphosphoglycerate-dependent phosphoglycerate mutase [Bombilactobacillus folatiphilus]|uniref:2,3-bisphosphoglycerate-dependent phosphoglycerate mutase n=1 Tax=Bombilactobacillus folatiphilus TaxID=2923362 RepID=A0ABY4PAM7_9LACO|nr:2,3-diphosphoglycerate-dependent phosphoglycerate mutase [Bombilactobacillus folatiphilus]UQS82392.1 2,3-diphosphoglycerate-dependent phosphoglycerate mutase [Bombilactobacillus folatiphilus]